VTLIRLYRSSIRLFIVLALLFCSLTQPAEAQANLTRVAILPFGTPKGQTDLEQYGVGTMDTLIQALSALPQFVMIDRARIESILQEQQFAQTGMVDTQTAVAVGKIVGAQSLITGNILKAGNLVRITAHFTDMKTGQIGQSEVVTGPLDSIFDLMDQLARKFIEASGVQVTAEQQQRVSAVTKATASLGAYDYYLQGRKSYLKFTNDGYEDAVKLYKKAIEADPQYALAYAGLAEALDFWGYAKYVNGGSATEEYQQAMDMAQKAVALDPNLPEAHRALGGAGKNLGTPGFVAELQKALELKPNDAESWYQLWWATSNNKNPDHEYILKALALNPDLATAHHDRGVALYDLDRYDESINEYKEALRITPNKVSSHLGIANALSQMKRFDEAIAEYQTTIQLEPNYAYTHTGLGTLYYTLKRYDESIAEFKAGLAINPNIDVAHFNLGLAYMEQGHWDDAVSEWQETLRVNPQYSRAQEWIDYAKTKRQ